MAKQSAGLQSDNPAGATSPTSATGASKTANPPGASDATDAVASTREQAGRADVDAYIASQPEGVQPLLHEVRTVIREAAPDATEKISWRMPTFWRGRNIIHFAAFKQHIGLYPGPRAIEAFAERLSGYRTSKGTIQLPLDKPIDRKLITDIVHWQLDRMA